MQGKPTGRTAIVVIHGIGEQPPLATLGRFTQGLIDHTGAEQPQAVLRQIAGERRPLLRFSDLAGTGPADVLEYAWQHLAQGRISSVRTLRWLLATTIAPLHFRRHWRLLSEAGEEAPAAWLIVLRQLMLAGALLLPVLLSPALITTAVLTVRTQFSSGWPAAPGFSGWFVLSLAAALLGLLQLRALAGDAWESWRIRRRSGSGWSGLYGGPAAGWRWPALLVGLLTLLFAGLAGWRAAAVWLQVWTWLQQPAGRSWLLGIVLVVAGLAVALRFVRFLRDWAGDIALYVTADHQAAADRSRHHIKEGAARLIEALLRDPDYERVVLVGHSLGSVIAFDALNVLSRGHRLENVLPPAPLAKLHGLLTMGSPLDKVAYFFREQTADDAAIHAQLLSFLHPTARRPSRRDDGPYAIAAYEVPLRDLCWTAVHAPLDVISDPLVFYRTSRLLTRPYLPAGAHQRYFSDPQVYAELLRLCRGGPGSLQAAASTAAPPRG